MEEPVGKRSDRGAASGAESAGDEPSGAESAGALHARSPDEALEALRSTADGLDEAEAARRLERHGLNRLAAPSSVSALKILLDQLRSVVVVLLIAAAAGAFALGDVIEAIAIGVVVLINTGIGFVVEWRARRAMEALLRYEVPRASVVRSGQQREVAAESLVPGDVLVLEAGDSVPADARLLEGTDLRSNEAALTGESLPVSKEAEAELAADTPLPDRRTMVHTGTTIAAGSGRAVVTATGDDTELGRIGGLVGAIEEGRTPLERRLDALGHRLIWITLAVAAVVTAVGVLQGKALGLMLETGVALAIAAVPEGLPAVATIALAVGLRRMARRHALIRRLHAVEALGATTAICTDKTGTLTGGEMTVTRIWAAGETLEVTGVGYGPDGSVQIGQGPADARASVVRELAEAAVLASRAGVERESDRWVVHGDPTEAALVVLGRKVGVERDALLTERPQVAEVPFSSERQFLASVHQSDGDRTVYLKGAPGPVLERCASRRTRDGTEPLGDDLRAEVHAANDRLAGGGLRVLAIAAGPVREDASSDPRDLVLLGLVGMMDPPAPGVRETITSLSGAGIRTIMITGDQRLTAEVIGRDLGVLTPEEETLDGRELHHISEDELAAGVERIGVFSRVSPEDKLKIVSALQKNGQVVAMLGDGVNDAAALKKADVGVAMGGRGTDVAKEVAAVVLQDDRFPTIAAAVEEGRVIFDNIRKFVFYLFSCNLAEVMVLLVAGIAGWPLPLLPLQILWLNLVTDTFPALALAMEPGEPGVMSRPPRDPRAAILSPAFLRSIGLYASMITAVTLAAFLWGLGRADVGVEYAVTLSFMTLALAQIFHLGNARSTGPVLARRRILANRYALGAVALVLALQIMAVHLAPLARVLDTRPLALGDWVIVILLASVPAVAGQLLRWRRRDEPGPAGRRAAGAASG